MVKNYKMHLNAHPDQLSHLIIVAKSQ